MSKQKQKASTKRLQKELSGLKVMAEINKYSISYLRTRITMFRAEVAELKPYKYGYDPCEKLPEEGKTVIASIGSWLLLAQYRNREWHDALGLQMRIYGGVDRWWNLPKVQE